MSCGITPSLPRGFGRTAERDGSLGLLAPARRADGLVAEALRRKAVDVRLGLRIAGQRGQAHQEVDLLAGQWRPAPIQLQVRDREVDVGIARGDGEELEARVEG